MKNFIRERLLEAFKTDHFIERETERVNNGRVLPSMDYIPYDMKKEIKQRIAKLESLDFGGKNPKQFAIVTYRTPNKEMIKYGKEDIDKGNMLVSIIDKSNEMPTVFWHVKFTDRQNRYFIEYDDLLKYVEEKGAGTKNKPITIDGYDAWKRGDTTQKRETFKAIKTTTGEKVRYYQDSAKFETLNGESIDITNIFDKLPSDEMKLDIFTKSDEDTKFDLISLMPSHLSQKAEELLESLRKR